MIVRTTNSENQEGQGDMRTVEWDADNQTLKLIDQRNLPSEFNIVSYQDHHQVAQAIRTMVVRGAPAIGVTAAFGLALAAQASPASDRQDFLSELQSAADELADSRPTAVNLKWAMARVLKATRQSQGNLPELRAFVLQEAQRIADEDVEINRCIATYGAELIEDGDTIIHHCNTGALATVDWGTALGVIRMAHEQGKHIHVLVDETRPRLQGARLTAWELQRYGIPFDIISDNAAGYFLKSGEAQKVFFGADRVAANGDVANKIGTYMLSLAAQDNDVPVYAVVPTSTIDLDVANGELIPIEERDSSEVLGIMFDKKYVVPEGASARNPAFDITPYRLITAIVTERGVIRPPFGKNLESVCGEA